MSSSSSKENYSYRAFGGGGGGWGVFSGWILEYLLAIWPYIQLE